MSHRMHDTKIHTFDSLSFCLMHTQPRAPPPQINLSVFIVIVIYLIWCFSDRSFYECSRKKRKSTFRLIQSTNVHEVGSHEKNKHSTKKWMRKKEMLRGKSIHIHKSDHEVMNAKWFSFHAKHIYYIAKSWPFKKLAKMIYGSCKLFCVVTRCENIFYRALSLHRGNEISLRCVCFMWFFFHSPLSQRHRMSANECHFFVCRVDLVACLITHRHTCNNKI